MLRVRAVLAGAVVMVLRRGRVRRELLQPHLVIVVEARFLIVDEHGSGYVRCHFVTCKSRPYVAHIPIGGYARGRCQPSQRPLASTSSDGGYNSM